MSRAQIWEDIYTALLSDTTLMALLGPVTTTNFRVLRSWPQLQEVLTDYEPVNEGWLVIDEPVPSLTNLTEQLTSIYDTVEPTFHVVATRFSLIDDVIDRLDQLYNWSVEQQRDLQFGERIVLMTRRGPTGDTFDKEVKLPKKTITYHMDLVLTVQIA